jgi:serine/threonine-protein kinase
VWKLRTGEHDPRVGEDFGPYKLEGVLGEGGMAIVYRAVRNADRETVALKVMKPELNRDETFRRRFVHEARTAAAVRHPNLVPIFDAGEVDEWSYLAFAYVEGRTLEDRIRDDGALPTRDVLRIAREVAGALDALHAQDVVHRDVKTSNIFLDASGSALLGDFGLARGRTYTALTKPGQVVGTLDYLAPELIRGKQATAASDVYALGCTIYECVAGKAPFGDRTVFEVGLAHLEEEPADPAPGRDDWSPQLTWALLRALEKDPERRPPSATAFATMLDVAAAESSR